MGINSTDMTSFYRSKFLNARYIGASGDLETTMYNFRMKDGDYSNPDGYVADRKDCFSQISSHLKLSSAATYNRTKNNQAEADAKQVYIDQKQAELDSTLKAWKDKGLENTPSAKNATKKQREEIDNLRAKLDDYVELRDSRLLECRIQDAKISLADAYANGMSAERTEELASTLAAMEIQYFDEYQKDDPKFKNGMSYEKRKQYIDELKSSYTPDVRYDVTTGKFVGISDGKTKDIHIPSQGGIVYATADSKSTSVETASENTKDKKAKAYDMTDPECLAKPESEMTAADKRAYIEQYGANAYPVDADTGHTDADGEYGATLRRKYIQYKQDLGVDLTDKEKQWAIDDFRSQSHSISNMSDAKAYIDKKNLMDKYASELSATNAQTNSGQLVSKEQTLITKAPSMNGKTVSGNPYEFINPTRPTGMSDTDYNNLCEQTKQEHIAKVNNEMADKVIRGEYGNGQERFDKLSAAGYDYSQVQSIVNQKMAAYEAQTSATTELQPRVDTIDYKQPQNPDQYAMPSSSYGDVEPPLTYDQLSQNHDILRGYARELRDENVQLKNELAQYKRSSQRELDANTESGILTRTDAFTKPESSSAKNLYVDTPAPDLTVSGDANAISRVNSGTYIDKVTGKIDNTKLNEMVGAKFETNDTQKYLAKKFETNKTQEYLAQEVDNSATTAYLKEPIDNSKVDLYIPEEGKKNLRNRFNNVVAEGEAANNAAKQAQHDAEAELGS